ncbi:MAG: acyltransferase [Bacteroidota bacterium]|nr:acyltransferase [Bacteroidota bacterium]
MNSNSIKIIEPQTKEQFEAYYLVRFEVLRKPWGQPPGSEKDQQEDECIHLMAVNSSNEILGVCRLQFNSTEEAQLRFMGVRENTQGQGIGKMLISHAEKLALKNNAKILILQAREIAVPFYKRCGYTIEEKSFLMWGTIQHYLMKKEF